MTCHIGIGYTSGYTDQLIGLIYGLDVIVMVDGRHCRSHIYDLLSEEKAYG